MNQGTRDFLRPKTDLTSADRDIMKNQHVNPEEAVLIHKDINSKQSIGMHWGTFVLTDERLMDPKLQLERILEREQM